MKFWQKTFILTLSLFLICFGVGIFSIASFFNGQLVENCENTCLAEEFYIARSFAADSEYTLATGSSISELMISYCEYYADDGIHLAIEYAGERVTGRISTRLSELAFSDFGGEGETAYFHHRADGKRYILIKSEIENGRLVYIKDISYLDTDWHAMILIFVTVAIAVAAVLAFLLFLLLKSLSSPLAKLTESTEKLAAGDYSVRAEEKGGSEFRALAKSFNNMTERISDQIAELEVAADQKQQLVDNLSHEMRTPLTSIHGYAEYLLSAAVDEEERIDALLCIMSESERLSKLGRSLLDISYVGNTEPSRERVELCEILLSAQKRFELSAKDMGVELDVGMTDISVIGDRVLFELLVSNLTDNALKACKSADVKRVSVKVSLIEEMAEIQVTDSGRGMTEQELLHITEPFYRTDKARSRADGGAGLGLALCRKITDVYGGSLTFASEPGRGTTATVRLNIWK